MERSAKRRRVDAPGSAALPGFAQVDLEQDYLQRSQKKRKDESNRLMVKKAGEWIEDERARPEQQEQEDDEHASIGGSDGEDSGVADVLPKPAPRKPQVPPKEEIRLAKEELARIAGLVSESPEENIGMLGSLAQITESDNAVVKKLALGTQLAVYKDIIPGYRIRPLSKEDLQAKLSKDVRKLRNFEQGLLGGYKDYVQSLGQLAKKKDGVDASVASVAISCACALLTSVPHFNCRNDLIGLLVQKLAGRNVDADFVKCREALEQLFQDDEDGHSSLEAVSQLTKMMKGKGYGIHESVLNTFLHLRLLSEFAHKASTNAISKDDDQPNSKLAKKQRQKKEFRTKRERKIMKERREVEKEMKEADAAVSYEERDKNQAETLKLVFVAYFRILKARTQHLMGAVLEGLAKYAHLINQDFFGDVLEALKDLINDAQKVLSDPDVEDEESEDATADRNATRESLLCIITAFALLQGQTDVVKSVNSLHLDLNFFITHLYRTLLPLSMDPDIELSAKKIAHLADPNGLDVPSAVAKDSKVNVATTAVLLLRSLSAVLLPPTNTKSVPPVRVAAFVKQLATLSLHLPQKSALAVSGLLQQVGKTHGKKVAALWNTEERKGDGVFDALSEGVEGSNVFAATVWEGELMRMHWDPRVREGWKGVEREVVEGTR